jgi:hypothetical protein
MNPYRPFGPDDLDGVPGIAPDELAAEMRLARELEAVADRGGIPRPSADFADRVMAAVAAEPVPSPVIAAGSALRRREVPGFLRSLRDAFRVTFGGGFPLAVRAQALAIVLLVVGITAGMGYATAGALGLFSDQGTPSPAPSLVGPTVSPVQILTPAPSDTPDPSLETPSMTPDGATESPEASGTPEASEEPGDTPEPEDHGGGGGGSSGGDGGSQGTPSPTHTPRPTAKPTPEPTDDSHEDGHGSATSTPRPTDTPTPSPTSGEEH